MATTWKINGRDWQICDAVPAVWYRDLPGWTIRVEREGKGGHLTLANITNRMWYVVLPGAGVVGKFGRDNSGNWIAEFWRKGEITYTLHDRDEDAIADLALYWLS